MILFGNPGTRKYVRRPKNKEYDPKFVMRTVKHGGAKINVWDCFSYNGIGTIFWIKEILKTVTLFQKDNDPKYTSTMAKN